MCIYFRKFLYIPVNSHRKFPPLNIHQNVQPYPWGFYKLYFCYTLISFTCPLYCLFTVLQCCPGIAYFPQCIYPSVSCLCASSSCIFSSQPACFPVLLACFFLNSVPTCLTVLPALTLSLSATLYLLDSESGFDLLPVQDHYLGYSFWI